MQYYLSVTVTGKLELTDKDSYDPKYLSATVIGESAEKLANKLRREGFKVEVNLTHGSID